VVTGQLVTALRMLGFDRVFPTEFTADLTIMEEGREFIARIQGNKELPHITSCCPGWVKYAEHNYPDLLDHLSTAKSPQQMFSTLAKTYYAQQMGIDPEKIFTVSVMPCTAKKFEKNREEHRDSGFQDTDAVLTTRELARMLKEVGIDLVHLHEEDWDSLMGSQSGAASIFGTTGGVTEAALRTVKELLTGEPLDRLDLGFMGVKEAEVGDRWPHLQDRGGQRISRSSPPSGRCAGGEIGSGLDRSDGLPPRLRGRGRATPAQQQGK